MWTCANFLILCSDATVRPALEAVHKTIRETLPPIAGVLNGAMVLRDMSVRNSKQLVLFTYLVILFPRPKVYQSMSCKVSQRVE